MSLYERLKRRARRLGKRVKKRRRRRGKAPSMTAKWKKLRKKVENTPRPKPKTGCGGAGYPAWSGADSILEIEVEPVAAARGVPVTSSKRSSTLGNPGSDHYVGNTTASARDLGTTNGAPLAYAVAQKLGISGYRTGNYNPYYIRRCNKTFRVQILWAVQGHYDHVHVGVKLS